MNFVNKYSYHFLLVMMIGFLVNLVNPHILHTAKTKLGLYTQPTPTVTVTSPTPYPTAQISQKIAAPTTNSDPFVTCNVHADCGGGTKQLRRSVCNSSTCCQIDGNWLFYESSTKCKQDQSARTVSNTHLIDCTFSNGQTFKLSPQDCANAKSTGSTYTYPTWVPLPTISNPGITYTTTAPPQPTLDNSETCNGIKQEWEVIKNQIQNQTYSSSAEQAAAYLSYKDSYNSQYQSNGCSGKLN